MVKTPTRTDLREALLLAAEAVIERKGSQALRARELTEAAGCALGALYNVFPDMDALVVAVKLRILDRLDQRMRAVSRATGDNDAEAVLLGLADAYLDFALAEPRQWQALFKHQLSAGTLLPQAYFDRLGEIFAHVEAPLAQLVPGMGEAGRAQAGRALFAGVHGIVLLGLEQRLGETSAEMIRAQFHLLVGSALRGMRDAPA